MKVIQRLVYYRQGEINFGSLVIAFLQAGMCELRSYSEGIVMGVTQAPAAVAFNPSVPQGDANLTLETCEPVG